MKLFSNRHKNIAAASVGIAVLLSNIFSSDNISAILSHFIKDDNIHKILCHIVTWLVDIGLFALVFYTILFLCKIVWKVKNKDKYLSGVWLHIHDKENVKIGVVEIKQDFKTIYANATNFSPAGRRQEVFQTRWEYIGNTFDTGRTTRLACCYCAQRAHNKEKYGVHLINNIHLSKKGGYPDRLMGTFGDCFIEERVSNREGYDKTGDLYLYRLGKYGINLDKKTIKRLLENPTDLLDLDNAEFKNSDFSKTLVSIIRKNRLFSRYNAFMQRLSDSNVFNTTSPSRDDVDTLIYNILLSAIASDSRYHQNETEIINELLRRRNNNQNTIPKINITDISGILNCHPELLREFKEITMDFCRYIISSDGIKCEDEAKYLEQLEELLDSNSVRKA